MTTSISPGPTGRPVRAGGSHGDGEATTALPGFIDMGAVLPELSSPQERYDHGFKRGYLAGYAEGARQANVERAADLATQKANWAMNIARLSAVAGQLAKATEEYVERFGARDGLLTEQLIAAAFEIAEAVVQGEIRSRPELAVQVARSVLAELPAGPAIVRVNPTDEQVMRDAVQSAGDSRYGIEVVTDPNVGPGGCIVMSDALTVDARIEHALARAARAFRNEGSHDDEEAPAADQAGRR
ncbi:MAG TPA: FliH/SctL family protein [Acidimicrobiales bacterium]|nr:FliH/SctL family protein [Acidimicrobiales bacterium]